MPLTATQVKAEVPAPNGKARKVFDGRGLFLHIDPNGAKRWRMKYRFAGKEKLLALGVYPDVTLAKARQECDNAKRLLASGVDPSAQRRSEKMARETAAVNTVEKLARRWHSEVHQVNVCKEHASRNLRRMEMYVFPIIGQRSADDVTPGEMLAALQKVVNAGYIETAHRVKTLLSQVWCYGIPLGVTERYITADLRNALPGWKQKHHPAITDPAGFRQLLLAIDAYPSMVSRIALQLSALLFPRPGELRFLRWDALNLDAEHAIWNYTPEKDGGPMIVRLPHQATSLLRAMQPLSGKHSLVFPSQRRSSAAQGKPISEATLGAALHTMGYQGMHVPHGFRASARTLLVEELEVAEPVLEMQLAHSVRDHNGRAYNRATFLRQRGLMLQQWADYLDELRSMPRAQQASVAL